MHNLNKHYKCHLLVTDTGLFPCDIKGKNKRMSQKIKLSRTGK
jgi:hypothetical protein